MHAAEHKAPAGSQPLAPVTRLLLILAGSVCLGLAILGIFLPGLPTTPLLLLAAGLYARSSDRLYRWMLSRPWLQGPLEKAHAFQRRRALPRSVKLTALGFAWGSVALTLLAEAEGWATGFVLFMALACTLAMSLIKTEAV